MRALLDVNVLIALLDSDHVSHQTALSWFVAHAQEGWASCPITQNGCVRIMSNPSYPNPLPVQALVNRLADACNQPVHKFWADESSLLDASAFDAARIHGPRQITDVYLLGLAVRHDGVLVTFDRGIPIAAVRNATPRNVLVL
ncbi:MAG: TA system VapC family ribonuclease toxin [Steroidobacteraceae bacterium]